MKDFLRFAFSFLYTRNWHTGKQELSQRRLAVVGCMFAFVVVSLIMIGFLQAPLEVVSTR